MGKGASETTDGRNGRWGASGGRGSARARVSWTAVGDPGDRREAIEVGMAMFNSA